MSESKEQKVKWNVVGAISCLVLFAVLETIEIISIITWKERGHLFIICAVLYCLLLPAAFLLYKLKVKAVEYFLTMLALLFVGFFVGSLAPQFTLRNLLGEISDDLYCLNQTAIAINDIWNELDYTSLDESSRATYDALCDGVMITDWDIPKNDLERGIADKLEIASFEDYKNDFGTAPGTAQVYAKVTDGKTDIRLINPTPLILKTGHYDEPFLEIKTNK